MNHPSKVSNRIKSRYIYIYIYMALRKSAIIYKKAFRAVISDIQEEFNCSKYGVLDLSIQEKSVVHIEDLSLVP